MCAAAARGSDSVGALAATAFEVARLPGCGRRGAAQRAAASRCARGSGRRLRRTLDGRETLRQRMAQRGTAGAVPRDTALVKLFELVYWPQACGRRAGAGRCHQWEQGAWRESCRAAQRFNGLGGKAAERRLAAQRFNGLGGRNEAERGSGSNLPRDSDGGGPVPARRGPCVTAMLSHVQRLDAAGTAPTLRGSC